MSYRTFPSYPFNAVRSLNQLTAPIKLAPAVANALLLKAEEIQRDCDADNHTAAQLPVDHTDFAPVTWYSQTVQLEVATHLARERKITELRAESAAFEKDFAVLASDPANIRVARWLTKEETEAARIVRARANAAAGDKIRARYKALADAAMAARDVQVKAVKATMPAAFAATLDSI